MSADLNTSVTEAVDQDLSEVAREETPLVYLDHQQVSKILLLMQKQTDSIQRKIREKEARIQMQKGLRA